MGGFSFNRREGGDSGVIGSAQFDSAGAVSNLVASGIISGVTFDATGVYNVAFATPEPDTNYFISAMNMSPTQPCTFQVSRESKTVNGFTLKTKDGSSAVDADSIDLTVSR